MMLKPQKMPLKKSFAGSNKPSSNDIDALIQGEIEAKNQPAAKKSSVYDSLKPSFAKSKQESSVE